MQSRMLTDYVKNLHLREDAPMPSQVREAHEKVVEIREHSVPVHTAQLFQFKPTTKNWH
jgi:hypothetical protein